MPRKKTASKEALAARKATRRRDRYREDPEFRDRIRAANKRHAAQKRALARWAAEAVAGPSWTRRLVSVTEDVRLTAAVVEMSRERAKEAGR